MRIGRPTKKRKSSSTSRQTQNPNPPKFSSPTLVVGQIQSNVVQSVLAPRLTELAVKSVEEYADAMMIYDQQVTEAALSGGGGGEVKEEEEEAEVELDLDGNVITKSETPPTPPSHNITPPSSARLFTTQSSIDELTSVLTDTSSHFSTPKNAWKVHANARKFERLLDEKYGRFRPFIEANPQVEIFIKSVSRKHAMGHFSPLRRGDPPINRTTAIMLLFMMHRQNVRFEALVLAATFCLVGLQPWALVALVALGKWEMDRRRCRRVYGMPRKLKVCEPYYAAAAGATEDEKKDEDLSEEEERAKKYEILTRSVGSKFNPADLSLRDEEFDVLLLGSGSETLYAGALLARAGRKVCVLSPQEDVSECMAFSQGKGSKNEKFANVPFDVKSQNVSHVSKQQKFLAPALCTATDTQGGIRFAKVGSPVDGYAHSILSVPGLGTDNVNAEHIPVVVNAEGLTAIAEFCSTCLGDGFPGVDLEGNDNGNSTSLGYLKACKQINANAGSHFIAKLFSKGSADPLKTSNESNAYQAATIRPASAFLNKCLPLNPHVRSFMAALGNPNENLSPQNTSMAAHVTHLCAMTSEEGMSYPIGGPRALCHALTSVIEQCGGRVVGGVALQELLFEKLPEKKKEEKKEGEEHMPDSGPKPKCKGIRLANGCEITVSETEDGKDGAVLSTLGMIPTFLNLLPPDVRTAHGVPPGLPAISERRPLVKIMVGLNGTAEDLSITGADWYRLPNASLPRDNMDPATGQVEFGNIGFDEMSTEEEEKSGDSLEENAEAAAAAADGRRGKQSKAAAAATKKGPRSRFTMGQSWMKVSFPSAKDPSWTDRHGSISTCVVTVEADDDLVTMFTTQPKIYSVMNKKTAEMERLMDKVMKDLVETFPQLTGKIECIQTSGPHRSGLVQNPARFAIRGNRPSTTYPNLYLGGSDLTVSDSLSGGLVGGWLAANAVMGYDSIIDHLYLNKNITADLELFLDEPSLETVNKEGVTIEDLAVPFSEKEIIVVDKKKDAGELDADTNTNTAESTKEE